MQNSFDKKTFTLNCKGNLLTIKKPIVMGIVNVTPDSFFEESRINNKTDYLEKAAQMLADGATIIDIGGQSTRPNATLIDEETELKRVMPFIEKLIKKFPATLFSIDTFYSKVAHEAVQTGASIINDISGGAIDKKMWRTAADLKVPYILMHSRGMPQNMQQQTNYDNVTKEVFDFFVHKINDLQQHKIHDVIIDVGFGFAKTIEQNFELLNQLENFQLLEKVMLIGLSRKSMIWKTLKITADESLNGTTILNTIALQKGAKILRVHDVKEAIQAIQLNEMTNKN